MTQSPRTITVTTRRRAWRTRLTVTRPEVPHHHPEPRTTTPDRARELFTRTAAKHDLKIVLTEYRHALHSLPPPPRRRRASPAPESHR
jgi:hypothetical protein